MTICPSLISQIFLLATIAGLVGYLIWQKQSKNILQEKIIW